jgi:hypothetical protein
MNEQSIPAWLPWLALVTAIVVVAVLYWLKPPPRRVVVASSLLWERVLRERPPGTDRLRWWLSLVLAGLIATLIVSAVLPVRRATDDTASNGAASRLAVIVDNSPTMSTRTTDGATRLQHAIAGARTLIESRGAGDEIWVADTMRRIATPSFLARDDALAQLTHLSAAAGPLPALPLPAMHDAVEVMIFTDGVGIGALPAHAKVQSVFESVENAGIIAFELRALPADPRRYVAYVAIANAGGTRKSIELTVAGVGGKRVVKTLAIEGGGTGHELIDVSDFAGGPLRASIVLPGDGLALDDIAYAYMPEHRTLRVALVTRGNAFLEESLAAQPRVQLSVVAPERFDDSNYHAVVYDRIAPQARPRTPALLFRPASAGWLPPLLREISGVTAATWSTSHPLLENVSLRDLGVDRAAVFDLKNRQGKGELALASTSGGLPLIVASDDAPRWIAVAFAPEDSNFPLHAGFPVFLGNALDWMTNEQAILSRNLGVIELPLAHARVLAVDGSELPVQERFGGSLFEAQAPGLFTAVSARERVRIAANLLDRRITDVNRSNLSPFKPLQAVPTTVRMRSSFDAWSVLLLAAALLLLAEWWSWTRRLTV